MATAPRKLVIPLAYVTATEITPPSLRFASREGTQPLSVALDTSNVALDAASTVTSASVRIKPSGLGELVLDGGVWTALNELVLTFSGGAYGRNYSVECVLTMADLTAVAVFCQIAQAATGGLEYPPAPTSEGYGDLTTIPVP